MTQTPLAPPSGSRDFLPDSMRHRLALLARIRDVFERHGFAPMETPAFERLEVLAGKYGAEGDKLIFKILKRGEKAASGEPDMALRYDLTVPAVRFYAHRRNELPRIFKRYQMGPVWRADRPGRGRFREFLQCDVDIFGSASPLADIECLLALAAALTDVGLPDFTIRLNSRRVLHAMMTAYGVAEADHGSALVALDKLDKISIDGVRAELSERGIAAEALCEDIARDNFDDLLRNKLDSKAGRDGLAEIDSIRDGVAAGLPAGAIRFDPLLARGLDYYTGAIYEFISDGIGSSIAGGGRYDDLAGMFLKDSVPICGGSLGIERILMLVEERMVAPTPTLAYVTVWDADTAADSLALAARLRETGLAAEIDLTGAKLGRQFRTADARGCRFALVRGPEEREAGLVTVKDLDSGDQQQIALDAVASHLHSALCSS